MFSIGSLIVYSGTGVCRVEAVGPPPFDPGSKVEYYTLIPLQSTGTIYVPVDTKVFMRPILSREAAQELIRRIPVSPNRGSWNIGITVCWPSATAVFWTAIPVRIWSSLSKLRTPKAQPIPAAERSPARWTRIFRSGQNFFSTMSFRPLWIFRLMRWGTTSPDRWSR